MERVNLANQLEISRIIHGHWRLIEWGFSTKEITNLTQSIIDRGITTFDHADIYGNYECENAFGKVLSNIPEIRDKIQIISKCGIKLISDKYPERKIKTYDYSYEHIIQSVEKSLKNLKTDYLDLLLLHRPSPFFDPEKVSRAFDKLKLDGKVLQYGVSNFSPLQFEMLKSHLNVNLITNQIEISPYCLDAFEDGNIDYLLKEKIKPLAWSPLAGGDIFNPKNERGKRLYSEIKAIADELNENRIDTIIYVWLLKHPVRIIPIIGTGKLPRIINAIDAMGIEMTDEQWYRIYIASKGDELA
jgi:predicted oxidoreductase